MARGSKRLTKTPKLSEAAKSRATGVRYRAVCEDDGFKGKWTSDIGDAYADATHTERSPATRTTC